MELSANSETGIAGRLTGPPNLLLNWQKRAERQGPQLLANSETGIGAGFGAGSQARRRHITVFNLFLSRKAPESLSLTLISPPKGSREPLLTVILSSERLPRASFNSYSLFRKAPESLFNVSFSPKGSREPL